MRQETSEQTLSPEQSIATDPYIGLRIRLGLGDEALDPRKKVKEVVTELRPFKQHEILDAATTQKRIEYWEERKDVAPTERMSVWEKQLTRAFHGKFAQENETFFNAYLSANGFHETVDTFSEETAREIYSRYFKNKKNQSDTKQFVSDIIRTHAVPSDTATISNTTLEAIYSNGEKIAWLSRIFDEHTEIITQIANLQATTQNPTYKQAHIDFAQKNSDRINEDMTQKERTCLFNLFIDATKYKRKFSKPPARSKATTPRTLPHQKREDSSGDTSVEGGYGGSSRLPGRPDEEDDEETDTDDTDESTGNVVDTASDDQAAENADTADTGRDNTPVIGDQMLNIDSDPEASGIAASLAAAVGRGDAPAGLSDEARDAIAELRTDGDPDAYDIDTAQELTTALEALSAYGEQSYDANLEQTAADAAAEAEVDIENGTENGSAGESNGSDSDGGDGGGDGDG